MAAGKSSDPWAPILAVAAICALSPASAVLAQLPADPPFPTAAILPQVESEKEPVKATGEEKEKKEPGKDSEDKLPAWLSVHGQGTIVSQGNWIFHSPYVGPNSFLSQQALATSETATLFVAAKLPWEGGQIIFDPEIAGGVGLSNVFGLGAFPNGEITRVGIPQPTPYIARLVFQQTIELGGEWEKLDDGPNQVAGHRDLNRITFTVGRMSANDDFDSNTFCHEPRTQMMNWTLMYNGAWDYPANVRGYDYGARIELNQPFWAIRYGVWQEPQFANSAALDSRILEANGHALEVEYRWNLDGPKGILRLLGFLNRAHMGDYREALEMMPVNPDITQTRQYRYKYGFGLNIEQELNRDLGIFLRLGWDDGHTETWAFTECDRTASFGLLLKGRHWGRPQDQVGLGFIFDGLAQDHRNYLAAGGLGFELGDGKLNYGLEEAVEIYYNWQVRKGINVTLDFQGVNNPGYNRDRGPVAIMAMRVHMEF
jgi:high affinity Mn2+ porin